MYVTHINLVENSFILPITLCVQVAWAVHGGNAGYIASSTVSLAFSPADVNIGGVWNSTNAVIALSGIYYLYIESANCVKQSMVMWVTVNGRAQFAAQLTGSDFVSSQSRNQAAILPLVAGDVLGVTMPSTALSCVNDASTTLAFFGFLLTSN